MTTDAALSERLIAAADRLEDSIHTHHTEDGVLVGPDPIGKIHWRITRFLRSYLPFLPGDDRYRYVQAQAHWIRGLALRAGDRDRALGRIRATAEGLLAEQRDDGAWVHPPIRRRLGLVSTVEGAWGGLGLLQAYQSTGDERYLDGARRWCAFQREIAGFLPVGDGMTAKYYSTSTHRIPNVTTMTVWLFGEMHRATGENDYLDDVEKMLIFLRQAQLPSGELPYDLDRVHFQCFQYNSFEFLDLARFDKLQTGIEVRDLTQPLAAYIQSGVAEDGHCRYNCHTAWPETYYWNAAIGAALAVATRQGLVDAEKESRAACERLLTQQGDDDRFGFSRRNYRVLQDRRRYPRQLAMIMHCMRLAVGEGDV